VWTVDAVFLFSLHGTLCDKGSSLLAITSFSELINLTVVLLHRVLYSNKVAVRQGHFGRLVKPVKRFSLPSVFRAVRAAVFTVL